MEHLITLLSPCHILLAEAIYLKPGFKEVSHSKSGYETRFQNTKKARETGFK
jgi:hypothetical protein